MGLGCQPCEYYQSTAPSSPLDKALWIDTSSGPPWQLKVYHLATASWELVGGGAATPGTGAGFYLLDSQTLSGTAASIVLAAGAGTYSHLEVRFQLRGTDSAALQDLLARVNGDTGANYDGTFENVTSAIGVSQFAGQTSFHVGLLICAGTAAGLASSGSIQLFFTSGTTFQKSIQSRTSASWGTAASNQREDRAAGKWRSSAAVSTLTLLPAAGSFAAGSSAQLYGLA